MKNEQSNLTFFTNNDRKPDFSSSFSYEALKNNSQNQMKVYYSLSNMIVLYKKTKIEFKPRRIIEKDDKIIENHRKSKRRWKKVNFVKL